MLLNLILLILLLILVTILIRIRKLHLYTTFWSCFFVVMLVLTTTKLHYGKNGSKLKQSTWCLTRSKHWTCYVLTWYAVPWHDHPCSMCSLDDTSWCLCAIDHGFCFWECCPCQGAVADASDAAVLGTRGSAMQELAKGVCVNVATVKYASCSGPLCNSVFILIIIFINIDIKKINSSIWLK